MANYSLQSQWLPKQPPLQQPAIEPEEREIATLPWMIRLTVICFVALVIGSVLEAQAFLAIQISWALYLIAYLTGGFFSVQKAWQTIQERRFDINALMILAALGAALIGEPQEGALLMFLFALSNTLETYAMGRTHASIRALLALTPKQAEVSRNGEWVQVLIDDLQVGETVLIRPGAQVPADGVVRRGASAVNEAPITGESLPVEKEVGAQVFAGTFNGQGALEVEVTTAVGDSALARIVQVVREAREQKAASQDFTDRVIGQYYAYAVVAMTMLALVVPLLFGAALAPTLYRAMTLLVVASPCALVISIPATLLSALARSARDGVLFKGGRHLEVAAGIKVVAFDKTGTLTRGRPEVVAIEVFAPTLSSPEALRLAAAVEAHSEHPLARAIVVAAERESGELPSTTEFHSLTGAGAEAEVNGRLLQVGKPQLFTLTSEQQARVAAQQVLGRTVVVVGEAAQPLALLALADTLRPEAAATIARLRKVGIERVVMLTGDNHPTAMAIGQAAGVDQVYAELLPEQKVVTVQALQQRYGAVAMVGDGINDAPALATAQLGIAMGAAGTAVAIESADLLLVKDDLSRLPSAFALARRARRVVWQNLAFAFGVIVVLISFTLVGEVPLPVGVVGHEGSTLLVVANGLRLLLRHEGDG